MNFVSKKGIRNGSEKILVHNRINISDGTPLFDVLVLLLFLISLYVTPVFKKSKELALTVMLALVVVFLARYAFSMYSRKIVSKSESLFLWGQLVLTLIWAGIWGGFNAYVVATSALGWTSYFLTVSTLAIAAAYVLLHATSYILMVSTLVTMIWPSMIVNAASIPGMRGQASWMLLAMFWVFLIVLGVKHHKKVLEVLLQRSRMAAILEAIPGTICWFDKTMKLLGANSQFYSVFAGGQSEVPSMSEKVVDETIRELSQTVMNSEQGRVNGTKDVGEKTYYLVGQKYQFGDEALLVGVDISAQESLNQELEQERKRSYEIGKTAEINRLMKLLVKEEKRRVIEFKEDASKDLWERIQVIHGALEAILDRDLFDKTELIGIDEFARALDITFSNYLTKKEIAFFARGLTDVKFQAHLGGLLLCFSVLIHNSVEALSQTDEIGKMIRIRAGQDSGRLHIYLEDNGPGIDEIYAEMIFEPHISGADGKAGLGLAILNEIIYSYGGTAGISRLANPTRFFIDLPIAQES